MHEMWVVCPASDNGVHPVDWWSTLVRWGSTASATVFHRALYLGHTNAERTSWGVNRKLWARCLGQYSFHSHWGHSGVSRERRISQLDFRPPARGGLLLCTTSSHRLRTLTVSGPPRTISEIKRITSTDFQPDNKTLSPELLKTSIFYRHRAS